MILDRGETRLSRAIQRALALAGFYVVRIQSGTAKGGKMRLAPKGTPDLYVLGCGWLEVKTPATKPEPHQDQWRIRARKHGELVETVRSVTEAVAACQRMRACREAGGLTDKHRLQVIQELWAEQDRREVFAPLYTIVSEYHARLTNEVKE